MDDHNVKLWDDASRTLLSNFSYLVGIREIVATMKRGLRCAVRD